MKPRRIDFDQKFKKKLIKIIPNSDNPNQISDNWLVCQSLLLVDFGYGRTVSNFPDRCECSKSRSHLSSHPEQQQLQQEDAPQIYYTNRVWIISGEETFVAFAQKKRRKFFCSSFKDQPMQAQFDEECNVCQRRPILGVMYRCLVRKNFRMCQECEQSSTDPYTLLKIKDPKFDPISVTASFRENSNDNRSSSDYGDSSASWRRNSTTQSSAKNQAFSSYENESFTQSNFQSNPQARFHRPPSPPNPVSGHHPHHHYHPHNPPYPRPHSNHPHPHPHHPHSHHHHHPNHPPHPHAPPMPHHLHGSHRGPPAHFQHLQPSHPPNHHPSNVRSRENSQINEAESPQAINLRIPKPALRFIRHVSYPDGSVVKGGDVFVKTWRVRNDGKKIWPEGVFLVPAGGDLMCSEQHKELLPTLDVDEEQEINITLTAPTKSGLYTSYFRAQTSEGKLFGHRLWASVMVE